MVKHDLSVLWVILCLLSCLTSCANTSEVPEAPKEPEVSESQALVKTDVIENEKSKDEIVVSDEVQEFEVSEEYDPDAEYIQNYVISQMGDSQSISYTDSKYLWVQLKADENRDKIKEDSWAAIDEKGRMYSIIPVELHDDTVSSNEYICVEEKNLYRYDGVEVTQDYLNDGETLLRITSYKKEICGHWA